MTRKEYDDIIDTFELVGKFCPHHREDNWELYKNDEPGELVRDLSVAIAKALFLQDMERGLKQIFEEEKGRTVESPWSRENLRKFNPGDLN